MTDPALDPFPVHIVASHGRETFCGIMRSKFWPDGFCGVRSSPSWTWARENATCPVCLARARMLEAVFVDPEFSRPA